MYPVENMLLSRLLYQERLMAAERERQLRSLPRQRPHFFLHLRLWTGAQLIRLGNRLLTIYPPVHNHTGVGSHAASH